MDRTHIWYTMSLDGPQDEHRVTCENAIQITHDYYEMWGKTLSRTAEKASERS